MFIRRGADGAVLLPGKFDRSSQKEEDQYGGKSEKRGIISLFPIKACDTIKGSFPLPFLFFRIRRTGHNLFLEKT